MQTLNVANQPQVQHYFEHLSGDVVGPGFTSSHLDARKIFNDMIFGDGQHYLFNIGMNMYWLKFLDQANQLDRNVLEDALAGMNKG